MRPRPIIARSTWPMNRIIGAESCSAICTPCAALVAPGPRVTKQIPGRPVSRPSVSAIIAAPASCRHTVDFDRRVVHGVEGGEEGFARNAVDPLDALGDELVDENLSARSQSLVPTDAPRSASFAALFAQVRRRFSTRSAAAGVRLASSRVPAILAAMSAPADRPAEPSALATLNARSREIFRRIVDSYLSTGEPVGSRHLSRMLPMSLSPASVRNVMQDLEELGLIYAPHASAGRLPTQHGLRLLRRRAARIRRPRARGEGAHRQPGAGGGRGRRIRRRARRDDEPAFRISPAAPASCSRPRPTRD